MVTKATFDAHTYKHSDLSGLSADDHQRYLTTQRYAEVDHSQFITAVNSVKVQGSNAMTGAVTLIPGTNGTMAENADNKTITINASVGSGGGTSYLTLAHCHPLLVAIRTLINQ